MALLESFQLSAVSCQKAAEFFNFEVTGKSRAKREISERRRNEGNLIFPKRKDGPSEPTTGIFRIRFGGCNDPCSRFPEMEKGESPPPRQVRTRTNNSERTKETKQESKGQSSSSQSRGPVWR